MEKELSNTLAVLYKISSGLYELHDMTVFGFCTEPSTSGGQCCIFSTAEKHKSLCVYELQHYSSLSFARVTNL